MKKYCLVSDDSGHDYVIPTDKTSEWYKFDFDDYDFDLPDWAIMVEGGLEFENPTENGKELFDRKPLHFTREQYSEAMKIALDKLNMKLVNDSTPSSALDMDWSENLNTGANRSSNQLLKEVIEWLQLAFIKPPSKQDIADLHQSIQKHLEIK